MQQPIPQSYYSADTPPDEGAAAALDGAPTVGEHVAVLVCHGMGQQVRFETLDALAREVLTTAISCGTAVEEEITVALQPEAGSFYPRAELRLKKADGSRLDAHFYEAYWAPLTEGRVSLRETLAFFIDAGRSGLRFAWRDGVFNRWMFGGRQEFEIPARRIWQLGIALWILLLVTAAFTAVALLPAIKIVDAFRAGSADRAVAVIAAVGFSIGVILALSGAFAVALARVAGIGADTGRPKSAIDAEPGIMASKRSKRWMSAIIVALVVGLSLWATIYLGQLMYDRWLLPAASEPRAHVAGVIAAIALLAIEAYVLLKLIREFLIEFGGDVAAYVAPFKVSKFEEIRRGIQERGRTVARFVYAARAPGSDQPLYDRVMVVGHSLGSVLAYDTLNDAIKRDAAADGWVAGSDACQYDVVDRTGLLLTFGSPLDKTAFIFRTQKSALEVSAREKLASAVQPLIMSYANRRGRWINIWSRSDWISGPLGYYDRPQPRPGEGVCNIENRESRNPGKAHTEYWSGPLVRGVLHQALTGVCPGDVPEPQRSQIVAALESGS
jgi:hypothetical protein